MTDELDKILDTAKVNWNNSPDEIFDKGVMAYAKQAIQALIDRECTKARQEALQNWRFDIIGIIQGKELLFADDVRKQLADRRNELSNKENK